MIQKTTVIVRITFLVNKNYYLTGSDDNVDHDDIEKFITYGAADLEYDSDDSDDLSNSTIYLSSPTTDSGYVPFEVEAHYEFAQTRDMNILGHVI